MNDYTYKHSTMKILRYAAVLVTIWSSPIALVAEDQSLGAFTLSVDDVGKVSYDRDVGLLNVGGTDRKEKLETLAAALRVFYTALISGDESTQARYLSGEMLGAKAHKLPGHLTALRVSIRGNLVKIPIRYQRGARTDSEVIYDAHEWRLDAAGTWKVRSWLAE